MPQVKPLLTFSLVLVCFVAAHAEEIRPGVFRTPDDRFADLAGYDYEPHYIEIEGYRIHYVDEGPRAAEPVLLLHGEPTWAYLYRKVIPAVVDAGYRAIVPDLVGFGRSDKPANREDYSYALQVNVIARFIKDMDLQGITLFCQDWGGLVGLRVAAENEDRFARIIAANTGLPEGDAPDGFILGTQWTEPDPNATLSLDGGFMAWLKYSQTVPELPIGEIVRAGTLSTLSDAEVAAYDAPFPDARYKAGARVMPALVASQQTTNKKAWAVFEGWEKPFLTAFSDSDSVTRGGERVFQTRIPGAAGQPHVTIESAGHFLQEDKGEQLGQLIVAFIRNNPIRESTAGLSADDIPVAHTPAGYWKEMPAPVLAGCTEPIVEGAPDMRGMWKVVEATANGKPVETFLGSVQRIEQCGNRVVVTGGGVVHDMRCDGTYENGVNDIGEPSTGGRPIVVAASFEDGVHVLRPQGMPNITVEREIVDGDLVWRYGPALVLRLERIETE